MAKAIVKLEGCLTHKGNGRSFEKGKPQTLTDKAEIEYYRSLGMFSVRDLVEETAKPESKDAVPPEPKTVSGFDADTDTDTDTDGVDGEIVIEILTKDQLKAYKKPQLVKLAEERLVLLTGNESKPKMIEQILEAQIQLQENEADEEDDE